MKNLLCILAGSLMMLLGSSTRNATVPISYKDTTKPKYQYFIRLNVSVQEYLYMNKIKDSIISAYKDEMGNKTLSMYYQHENYLRERSTLDSVKVK